MMKNSNNNLVNPTRRDFLHYAAGSLASTPLAGSLLRAAETNTSETAPDVPNSPHSTTPCITRPVPDARHQTAPPLAGHTFHSLWDCSGWKSLGPDDFLPVLEPGQQWVDDKLIRFGIVFPVASSQRSTKSPVQHVKDGDAIGPACGSAVYYALSGNKRSLRAAEAGISTWKKYREISAQATPSSPGIPFPAIGKGSTIHNQLSCVAMGRTADALLFGAEALGRPSILDWLRDHLQWFLETFPYDAKRYRVPQHVGYTGVCSSWHRSAYTLNMQAEFATGAWLLGELYGVDHFRQIGEEMLVKRILPAQFEDGYWNYSESADIPKKRHAAGPAARFDNYTLCVAVALSRLLLYPRWRDDDQFKNALLQVCRYTQGITDAVGCVRTRPNLETMMQGSPPERPLLQSAAFASRVLTRVGRVYDKPGLLCDASRIVNYWYHNRPVLLPFFGGGMPYFGCADLVTSSWGYSLAAFFALTLAWEGWHIRRKNSWTVELVHQTML